MLSFRLPTTCVLAALAWLALAVPAAADDMPPLRSFEQPSFTADAAVAVDTSSRPTVQVTITVPYAELSWSLAEGGYTAGAGFAIELAPERGNRLYGDAWEKRLLVASYATTVSSRNDLVVTRSFAVPPGRYRIRVRVRDVSSQLESQAQDRLQVADLGRVPVGFTDLQLGVVDSAGAFLPQPTRRFGYEASEIAARTTLLDRRPGDWPRHYRYHWRILDEGQDVVAQGDTAVTLARQAEPVVVRPARPDLFIGSYSFEVELVEGKSRWKTGRSFDVEESGPPKGREFETLLEALAYIADPAEVDAMRNKTPDEQAALWERFWKRRDPTPETARNEFQIEFFRRLRYADQHFTGFGHGWRSDMGRIYIRFGPPDQTEQRPGTSTSPQLEIWYYNQPYRRFVFADREGFGRYSLVSPASE